MTKIWIFLVGSTVLMLLLAGAVACDDDGDSGSDGDSDTDSDTDSDSDSDSDADGDFPGNCDCAARFTLDGTTVKICENDNEFCRCQVSASGNYMFCFVSSGPDIFTINNFEMTSVESGKEYTKFVSVDSTMELTVEEVYYSAPIFRVFFEQWDGPGGTASGTFTTDVTLRSGDEVEITDGQFYAPIVQE